MAPSKGTVKSARDRPMGTAKLSRISTARLNALLRLHLRPIKLVVSQRAPVAEATWGSHLGVGFPLRCFQRLSRPDMATQRCPWRDNWYTRGPSTPVLSY